MLMFLGITVQDTRIKYKDIKCYTYNNSRQYGIRKQFLRSLLIISLDGDNASIKRESRIYYTHESAVWNNEQVSFFFPPPSLPLPLNFRTSFVRFISSVHEPNNVLK